MTADGARVPVTCRGHAEAGGLGVFQDADLTIMEKIGNREEEPGPEHIGGEPSEATATASVPAPSTTVTPVASPSPTADATTEPEPTVESTPTSTIEPPTATPLPPTDTPDPPTETPTATPEVSGPPGEASIEDANVTPEGDASTGGEG